MRKTLLALLLSAISGWLPAQDLTLTSDYNSQNQFVITAQKTAPGTYYVELHITELRNASPNHQIGIQSFTVTASQSLVTISPASPGGPAPAVRYSYRYQPGNPESRPDTAFVYRLPYSEHLERRVDSLYLIMGDRPEQKHNINWHSMQFHMQPGDTIYAARAGQVIRITEAEADDDPSLPSADGRITFKRNVNRVFIEHADGSYADYSVLGDIAVRRGDRVWPHTPIGLAGSYDGENYQLRLSVYYHRLPPRSTTREPAKFENHYIRPVFSTAEGTTTLTMRQTYRPAVTVDLITREMSRRQARQFEP
jgi:hypothetical protein